MVIIVCCVMITVTSYQTERQNIISVCIADVTGDGRDNVVVITGKRSVIDDIEYGETLKIYGSESISDIETNKAVPIFEEDLADLYPYKVQAGDIDGDGLLEISVSVYKTATFHPVIAKRPFFYRFHDNQLVPVWLGSRLSRPFSDYILTDVDNDRIDEIVSIEQLETGDNIVSAYYWKGFGFELLFESNSFSGILSFISNNENEIIVRCEGKDGTTDYKLWPDEKYESFYSEKIIRE